MNEPNFKDVLAGSVFKIMLGEISTQALEIAGNKYDYSDEELSDAMLVFVEVFMSKMYDFHKDKLTQAQLEELATEAGKSMRQTVLLFTGVDLHNVYKA